jgi:hypothetical protein
MKSLDFKVSVMLLWYNRVTTLQKGENMEKRGFSRADGIDRKAIRYTVTHAFGPSAGSGQPAQAQAASGGQSPPLSRTTRSRPGQPVQSSPVMV